MKALAVGGAHSMWRDIAAVERATGPWPGLIVATNNSGTVLPRVDAWVTLHPEKLNTKDPSHDQGWPWKRQREAMGYAIPPTWSHAGAVDHTLKGWSNGSSGLLAVGVALALGCTEVVCCGIRMDGQRNHFRAEKQWQQFNRYRLGWKHKAAAMKGRVYSVSGWTRELLGAPPWLEQATTGRDVGCGRTDRAA